MTGEQARQLRQNFANVEHNTVGLMVGQLLVKTDLDTLLLLCQELAQRAGVEAIEGLSVVEWYCRERLRRLDELLFALEDDNPAEAAILQERIDAIRRDAGMAEPEVG